MTSTGKSLCRCPLAVRLGLKFPATVLPKSLVTVKRGFRHIWQILPLSQMASNRAQLVADRWRPKKHRTKIREGHFKNFHRLTCGAAMPPILELIEHMPKATPRTTVGYNSAVYKYTVLKQAEAPNFPERYSKIHEGELRKGSGKSEEKTCENQDGFCCSVVHKSCRNCRDSR